MSGGYPNDITMSDELKEVDNETDELSRSYLKHSNKTHRPHHKHHSKPEGTHYKPLYFEMAMFATLAAIGFIVITSMGFAGYGALFSVFILILSIFPLIIIWILCYVGLSIIAWVIFFFGMMGFFGVLLILFINYDTIKSALEKRASDDSGDS